MVKMQESKNNSAEISPAGELEARKSKLKKLQEMGIEPYGRKFLRTHSIEEIKENFDDLSSSKDEVIVSGRIMLIRGHGKSSFADLQDTSGKIQVYARVDTMGEESYHTFKLVDIGDFIGVEGALFKTKTGEKSILIKNLTILSKSLRPLPEKWHGLKDVEIKYRRRYLDIIANEESRNIFKSRIEIVSSIRNFLNSRGYAEVETPILQPRAGGASGEPFKTRAEALDTDLYLRIAPELYLKRLLVAGWEKIYEMNRSFRNEGLSPRHNPEFTMLEVYTAYEDYIDAMELTEKLIGHAAETVLGKSEFFYHGEKIDLTPPWKRITFSDAMEEKFNINVEKEGVESLKKKLEEEGIKLKGEKLSRSQLLNLLSDFLTGKSPTFIMDYPAEFCPLAKRKQDNPALTERFELFMCGFELANAYSELNDPCEQRERFLKQAEDSRKNEIDEDFVTALEYGMPPAAGLGIGIDRLVMALTGVNSIRDVILFPQLKGR